MVVHAAALMTPPPGADAGPSAPYQPVLPAGRRCPLRGGDIERGVQLVAQQTRVGERQSHCGVIEMRVPMRVAAVGLQVQHDGVAGDSELQAAPPAGGAEQAWVR
jgi:hypothetical protein